MALSASTYNKIRAILVRREDFNSDQTLRILFEDPRLAPWKHNLRSANNKAQRVAMLVQLLVGAYNVQGDNALALFLYTLAEITQPQHVAQQLETLAETVRQETIQGKIDKCKKRLERYEKLERIGHSTPEQMAEKKARVQADLAEWQTRLSGPGFPPIMYDTAEAEAPTLDPNFSRKHTPPEKPLKDQFKT